MPESAVLLSGAAGSPPAFVSRASPAAGGGIPPVVEPAVGDAGASISCAALFTAALPTSRLLDQWIYTASVTALARHSTMKRRFDLAMRVSPSDYPKRESGGK